MNGKPDFNAWEVQVKMIVRARAPLRLGFAGGGTDVSPFCDVYGGAVLNVTINKYAYASLTPRNDGQIVFDALDLQLRETFPAGSAVPATSRLALHRGVYNRMLSLCERDTSMAFTLSTHVDAPLGSGLGSSSALVVAMVAAFGERLSIPLGEYEMARLAYDIERKDLALAGGRQDQYAATFGGFNFMEFAADERVVVNPLRIRPHIHNELEASILLAFTGKSRESARIIADQSRSVQAGGRSLEAMHQLKLEAGQMKEALLFGSIGRIADILHSGWEAKKRTAATVSTPEIEALFELALRNGAKAGKISGAGGGGFVMFIVDPDARPRLRTALVENSSTVPVACNLLIEGVTSWICP